MPTMNSPGWEYRSSKRGVPTIFIRKLFSIGSITVEYHVIVAPDATECFHSHPAHAWRIILWGGYQEQYPDRTFRRWRPFMMGHVAPSFVHRIHRVFGQGRSHSLWIRGPRIAETKLVGKGWTNY